MSLMKSPVRKVLKQGTPYAVMWTGLLRAFFGTESHTIIRNITLMRMPLNRVLVAALAVQVPDRILRVQGQNLKQKMYYGKICYTVQNAGHLVPVRQIWKILKLIQV